MVVATTRTGEPRRLTGRRVQTESVRTELNAGVTLRGSKAYRPAGSAESHQVEALKEATTIITIRRIFKLLLCAAGFWGALLPIGGFAQTPPAIPPDAQTIMQKPISGQQPTEQEQKRRQECIRGNSSRLRWPLVPLRRAE
jgi:hypothetical protein